MNKNKKLQLTLILLICLFIILIGCVGIYTKKSNAYKNKLNNYSFASDLGGTTFLEFEVDKSTETVYYDENGNKINSEDITEDKNNYKTEEILVNKEENLTENNYKNVSKIMKERLKFLTNTSASSNISKQYQLDYDKESGKIIVQVDYKYLEDIESILPMEGKLQLIDTNTKEVILDSTYFEEVTVNYAQVEEGYSTFLLFKLNKLGLEKINSIEELKTNTNDEGNVEYNKFKIMFDDEEISEISYEKTSLENKIFKITTLENETNSSTINSELNTNTVISKLATIGELPIVYKLSAVEFINDGAYNYINYIVYGIIAILVVIFIVFIIKYKKNGILNIIATVTNISLFLIIIRQVNVPISLNGFAGIIALIVLNTILTKNILDNVKEEKFIGKAYLKTLDVIFIFVIMFSVLSFMKMSLLSTTGFLMFWGWIIVLLGNLLFNIPMLKIVNRK